MENYSKGKCTEELLERNAIPIPNLPEDFLWMQVKGGSKMQRLTDHANSILENSKTRAVVWTGSGDGLLRTIACAEAMKRKYKLFQITKIAYRKSDEYWEPKLTGLDRLVVNRNIPVIHILLSLDPLNSEEPGYQAPDCKNAFWQVKRHQSKREPKENKRQLKVTADEILAMGLQSNSAKGKRHSGQSSKKKS